LSQHVFLKLFWSLNPCIKCPFDGEATIDTTRKICPIQMTCTTIPYVHSIGCRIGSGCKKWYLIINFSHVLSVMAYSSTMVMAETSVEHYNFYKYGWFIPTMKITRKFETWLHLVHLVDCVISCDLWLFIIFECTSSVH